NQRQIAEEQRTNAQVQAAMAEAAKAEALTESARAKAAARRAISARNEANKYSSLYRGLLDKKEKEFNKQNQELELRNKRDEANAYVTRGEQIDKAIAIYEELLKEYEAANDLRGQAEMHSQLSIAYSLAADKADKKGEDRTAAEKRQRSVAEYGSALGIIESESTKDIAAARGDKDEECSILWK